MPNKVDLPQPEGPMMETNSPGRTSNVTFSTAVTALPPVPKRLVTACDLQHRRGGNRGGRGKS